ncbi:L-lactate dehydrogenase [Williamsoniiplasma lucivorax]|uniref:L-lactate dehydrogenase n=1 Tax=Williamsoniiplasma lucivorax TaxID=209274 RepID=A0A2S5RCT8_9MOLU|nr:L-lactate dehydrogenase [Williamsoniiplasma lucivorax]PPE05130.1 L-lactate dehydrogenase [Williamsoniiplasma lucivorax]
MKKTSNKVVLIGAGAVGTSFLYAAINQGLASEYVLIDAFPQAAEGNAIDLSDAMSILPLPVTGIKAGDYQDCQDADLVVITAGRPQKPGETRLEMVAGNAVIMQEIAQQVKASGFSGITIIASNPVDVLTLIYQQVTGFAEARVIGSGTTLDSARLRRLVAEKLGVGAQAVDAYFVGEHGDSAVPVWSHAAIMGQPIAQYIKDGKITQAELDQISHDAVKMAYKIIELKRATFYGIGAALTKIARAILRDEKATLMVGAKLNNIYKNSDVYSGVPAIIGAQGIEQIIEWELTADEQMKMDASIATLKLSVAKAQDAIK